MNQNERDVITKALVRAAGMGLDIEATVDLIDLYHQVAGDIGGLPVGVINAQSEFRLAQQQQPPPPPPVLSGLTGGLVEASRAAAKPAIILSSTASIASEPTGYDRTLDECYQELKAKVPDFIEVLGPGRTVPARFMIEVYKRDASGIVPASFGVVLTVPGDRSQIEGKFTYCLDRPYDVDKDLEEFRKSILSMYANAGKKLVPVLPPVQLPSNGMGEQWA